MTRRVGWVLIAGLTGCWVAGVALGDEPELVPGPGTVPVPVVVTPVPSSSGAALESGLLGADPAMVVPASVELIDGAGEVPGPDAVSGGAGVVARVGLETRPVTPGVVDGGSPGAAGGLTGQLSRWSWTLGVGLLVIAGAMLLAVVVWMRVGGVWAGGVVLAAWASRSVGEVRALRMVARAADEPLAAVLLSRGAFDRGVAAMIEAKGGVPVGPQVLARVERVRSRAFV
jgi:hypothetical protein